MPRDVSFHPINIAIGGRVRTRRELLGLTQGQLASACGVTFQQMQKYESGQNQMTVSKLVQVAAALKTSASYLLGEKVRLSPDAVDLLRQFASLRDDRVRRTVIEITRQIAGLG
jgi:transcriptional regulator with XRE-family HTH domain